MKQMTLAAAAAFIAISGTAMADDSWTGPYAGLNVSAGTFNGNTLALADRDVTEFGVHFGYQHDFGALVLGVEAQIDRVDGFLTTAGDAKTIKLRAGYDMGKFQPYAILASRDVDDNNGNAVDGMGIGLGVEYKMRNNLRLGGEFMSFQDLDDGAAINAESKIFSMRLTYGF